MNAVDGIFSSDGFVCLDQTVFIAQQCCFDSWVLCQVGNLLLERRQFFNAAPKRSEHHHVLFLGPTPAVGRNDLLPDKEEVTDVPVPWVSHECVGRQVLFIVR